METQISCVVPAYNNGRYLRRAVESLVATGYPSLEILVVDDGSTDDTAQRVRELTSLLPSRIRYLTHPNRENRGVSETRNLGIREANGALICFLDADDYVYPHRFEKAIEILTQRSDIDGVYDLCEMVFEDSTAQQAWFAGQRLFGFQDSIPSDQLIFRLLRGVCWATSAIVLKRDLLERTGLFDPRLKIAEDCNLWFRAATIGKLVSGDLTRPVSAYWRHGDSAYAPRPEQRISMIRSMRLFLDWMNEKYRDDPRLSALSDAVSDYALQGIIEARGKKQRRLALRLALGGLRQLPALMRKRRYWGNLARAALGK